MDEKTIIVKKGSVGSFLQGIAIGAALALLLAPRTGRETRDMLTEKGNELKGKATEIASDTRDRAQGYISDARNKVSDTVKGVKEGISQTAYDTERTLRDQNRELKRDLSIEEDINNRNYPL